jgi:ribosomal protein S18 acetylase RimI-like enzyme
MKQQSIIHLFLYITTLSLTNAFTVPTLPTTPIMGIGAILLKPKNTIQPSDGDDEILINAAKTFTIAFWNGKTGGVKELSTKQSKSLTKSQITEFRRRYGFKMNNPSARNDKRSELVVCENKKNGDIMGCAGIEVCKIQTPNGKSIEFNAPLMSNLAVGKEYRRRGLAEDLVKAAEQLALREWGYDECYLFVEKQNKAAVRLYRKLGYKNMWEDDTATTLVPTARGSVISAPTVIICMKKKLGGGLLSRFLPF